MRKALRYLIPALALLGPSASSAGNSAETASEIREGMAKAMPSLSVSGAFPAGRMENRPFPLTSRPGDDKMKC